MKALIPYIYIYISDRRDDHLANKQIHTVTEATLTSDIVSQIHEMIATV